MHERVITPSTVLMVKPFDFGFSKESAESNAFQANTIPPNEAKILAIEEYEKAIKEIRLEGIEVISFEEKSAIPLQDAVFPNNWVGFHPGGKVILYPMTHENRRKEKNPRVLELVEEKGHRIKKRRNLSSFEKKGKFLEGTGSMVIDYKARIAYACISPRTDIGLLNEVCDGLGLEAMSFHSNDLKGNAIYHTNVMMAITEKLAIICMDSIDNFMEKNIIKQSLISSGLELMSISYKQMTSFCGNVFEVKNKEGKSFLICSETAWNAFNPAQQEKIRLYHTPLPIAIPTIETLGGGSARCMVAGVYF